MEQPQSPEEYFARRPQVLSCYRAFAAKIQAAFPESFPKVQKTQIGFWDKRPFCAVWLPIRDGMPNRPEYYLVVSFGLFRRVEHPRIVSAVEAYPNRWTHHVLVAEEKYVDDQLMEWISEAHECKQRRKNL